MIFQGSRLQRSNGSDSRTVSMPREHALIESGGLHRLAEDRYCLGEKDVLNTLSEHEVLDENVAEGKKYGQLGTTDGCRG